MQISQHTFLVTGGSSGLGAACARRFVAHGGNVVIADLNDAAGQGLVQELGKSTRFAHTDVTDEASVQQAIAAVQREFGSLHGVVQCAGIVLGEKIVSKDKPHAQASFAKVVGVNLVDTFNVLRLAAAAMTGNAPTAEGERGVIVNTASVAAFDGQIGQAAYA